MFRRIDVGGTLSPIQLTIRIINGTPRIDLTAPMRGQNPCGDGHYNAAKVSRN